MSTNFNVYFATSANGPWTLANDVPIDLVTTGNQYTITGLQADTLYYVSVVGGTITDSQFISLMSQEIGPKAIGAGDINIVETYPKYAVRTFSPGKVQEDSLSHTFTVI